MTYTFKKGTAVAGLTLCAAFGGLLAGCNGGAAAGGGGGGTGDSLATVGSAKVTRADLDTMLEAQQGETVLPYLIDTQLVFESLKAKGLDVTDAEVEADLARRDATDPSVKALMEAGGSKLALAKGQIKRELGIQKLATADIKATDTQVKAFFDKNKRYYDVPEKVKVGVLIASTKLRADAMARELKQKAKTFEALVAEQLKANDAAGQKSVAARPTFDETDLFGPIAGAELSKLSKGGTTAPRQFGGGQGAPAVFIIFKKVDVQPAVKADLAKMRPEVEMDYKLAEIAKKTASENPTNPPFDQTLVQTQNYLKQQNPTGANPPLRDVLSFINQTAYNKLMTAMRASGTVQIDDPTYAKVGESYKAAPAADAAPAAAGAAPASNTAAAPASNTAAAPAKP